MNFQRFLENVDMSLRRKQLRDKMRKRVDDFRDSIKKEREQRAVQQSNVAKKKLRDKINKVGIEDKDGVLDDD